MAVSALCRSAALTKPLNRVPTIALSDVRLLASEPHVLPAASDYAKVFFPRTTLARAV